MHSIVLKRGAEKIKVPSMRLDTFARRYSIDRLDLIRIDVEGAELKVLRGCKNTIKKFNPIFSIDVNHYEGEFEDIERSLNQYIIESTRYLVKRMNSIQLSHIAHTNKLLLII